MTDSFDSISIQLLTENHSNYIENPGTESFHQLNSFLRCQATRLVKQSPLLSSESRRRFSKLDEGCNHGLSNCLSDLWTLSSKQIESDVVNSQEGRERIQLAISALLLSRNLVAGSNEAQMSIYRRIVSLLELVHLTSSFSSLNSPDLQPLTRMAVQLLVNLVTQNDPLQKDLWSRITASWQIIDPSDKSRFSEIKQREFGNLFSRLLASPDPGTCTATQVLLLNCTKASYARSRSLCDTLEGIRILASFLNVAETTIEEDEKEGEKSEIENQRSSSNDEDQLQSQEERLSERLGIIHPIFTHLFSLRLFSRIFRNLSLGLASTILGEEEEEGYSNDLLGLITEQLTLLKLLDSYLYFKTSWIQYGNVDLVSDFPKSHDQEKDENEDANADVDGDGEEGEDLEILIDWFLKVTKVAQQIMNDSMEGESQESKSKSKDGEGEGEIKKLKESKLRSSHKVLVLTLQCLIAICVSTEGENAKLRFEESFKVPKERGEGSEIETQGNALIKEGTKVLRRLRSEESQVVEEAVELLKTLSKYSPAVSPFRPYRSGPAPDSHSLTSTGSAPPIPNSIAMPTPASDDSSEAAETHPSSGANHQRQSGGLAYLKRDLVRLLGVLSYSSPKRHGGEDSEISKMVRNVQDRVRELGGLFQVLNLTNLDELNPYIREHAIFTLRNLLASNPESQDLVARLKPLEK